MTQRRGARGFPRREPGPVARPARRSALEASRAVRQGELLAHCCYADEPIDATKVAAVFERAGLPGRLD